MSLVLGCHADESGAETGPGSPVIPALVLGGLRKTFARPAVDGLDLIVHPGEVFALLGPNGAGKTTTLRMVAGLLRPDAGSVHVFGIDVWANPMAAKQIMAWLPDEPLLYDKLTPLEQLCQAILCSNEFAFLP